MGTVFECDQSQGRLKQNDDAANKGHFYESKKVKFFRIKFFFFHSSVGLVSKITQSKVDTFFSLVLFD